MLSKTGSAAEVLRQPYAPQTVTRNKLKWKMATTHLLIFGSGTIYLYKTHIILSVTQNKDIFCSTDFKVIFLFKIDHKIPWLEKEQFFGSIAYFSPDLRCVCWYLVGFLLGRGRHCLRSGDPRSKPVTLW